jgi:hypothetical protein
MVSGAARAAAASCRIAQTANPRLQAGLVGVSVTSSRNAWAVGDSLSRGASPTLIERWNGKAWKVQLSPNPRGARGNQLAGVAATSSTNAWAVGSGPGGTLIEHWNGKAWRVQRSPNPGPNLNELSGVAATSPRNAWAVGTSSVGRTLIEHWNGKAWKIQASPNPGGATPFNQLSGVAATSATKAWAVGEYYQTAPPMWRTLVEHWDGKAWTVQASPAPLNPDGPSLSWLYGVAATSSTNAWVVGDYWSGGINSRTLIAHWDGKAWTVQPSPNLGGPNSDNRLLGVAATSPNNAWAVGTYQHGSGQRTLVERWDGKAWQVQTSPNLRGFVSNQLSGVASTSSTNAWAVGYGSHSYTADPPPNKTLVLNCR